MERLLRRIWVSLSEQLALLMVKPKAILSKLRLLLIWGYYRTTAVSKVVNVFANPKVVIDLDDDDYEYGDERLEDLGETLNRTPNMNSTSKPF